MTTPLRRCAPPRGARGGPPCGSRGRRGRGSAPRPGGRLVLDHAAGGPRPRPTRSPAVLVQRPHPHARRALHVYEHARIEGSPPRGSPAHGSTTRSPGWRTPSAARRRPLVYTSRRWEIPSCGAARPIPKASRMMPAMRSTGSAGGSSKRSTGIARDLSTGSPRPRMNRHRGGPPGCDLGIERQLSALASPSGSTTSSATASSLTPGGGTEQAGGLLKDRRPPRRPRLACPLVGRHLVHGRLVPRRWRAARSGERTTSCARWRPASPGRAGPGRAPARPLRATRVPNRLRRSRARGRAPLDEHTDRTRCP